MSTVMSGSHCGALALARSTNATDASFPTKIPTTTEPTGAGVIAFGPDGIIHRRLLLVPVGVGSDDNTMKVRVVGWRKIATLWVPTTLLEFTATLCTSTGVSGAAVDETNRFADTLSDPATGKGTLATDCYKTSPADNTIGCYVVDTRGSEKVELTFDRNSSATSCNCLYAIV